MSAETTFRRSNSIKKILSSPRDWTEWYGMTKSHAVHLQIWQYLDPEKEDGEIEQLVEPTRPVIPEIDLTSATCSQQLNLFNYSLRLYEIDYNKWKTANTNLRTFRTDLIESVEYNKVKDLVIDYIEPRDILKKLKERLCPTETDRRSELRHRYRNLLKTPKSQDRERWIDEWRDVVRDLTKAKEIDAKNAKEDFYFISKEIDVTIAEIIWDRDLDKDESFHDFTERFVRKYRENTLQNQRKGRSAFATTTTSEPTTTEPTFLGQPPSPNLLPAVSTTQFNRAERECLCGERHTLSQCYYINESKRPAGWKPNNETVKKVEGKIRNGSQNLKIRVSAIRKKSKDIIAKRSNTNLDKATPVPSTAQDTFTSNYTASSTDDVVYHSATTIQPAAMSNQSSDSPLRDSVIVDPASHVHVGNNKDRFESIEPCYEELLTGDHRTIIRGYGKMHVQLNKDGRKEVLRAYAAYVPGFHTNLISAKILKEKLDVCFDQRSEELQIGPKCELFSKLQYKLGMYCIEYNSVHALVTGSNFPSPSIEPKTELKRDGKQKTSTVPKLSIGTKALWQSRLGHPSDEAIRHLSNASTGVKITDAEIAKPKAGEPRPLNEIQELAVAKEQISRRKAIKATRPFERLCWDMIFLSTPAYNADTIVSHFYDPYLHLHLTETLWKKGESVDSIIGMVNKIERKFPQYKVAIIQTDEEQILVNSNKFNAFIKDRFWDT
jgi:hypothetical protein